MDLMTLSCRELLFSKDSPAACYAADYDDAATHDNNFSSVSVMLLTVKPQENL